MPDDDQGSKFTADANTKTKILTAETAAINAELAHIAAARKLADARAPVTANSAADKSLAAATVAKDIAQARKVEAESELAWMKAKLGEIPASGIAGAVELGERAGTMESALLASKAMARAAETAAAALSAHISGKDTVIVFPSGQIPDLKALTCFRACNRILQDEFANAMRQLDNASAAEAAAVIPGNAPAAFAVPAIGLALDAVSKIAGYFRSDYKVGGTELTADHAAFAEQLAGTLLEKIPEAQIHLPTVYESVPQSALGNFFNSEMAPLSKVWQEALTKLDGAGKRLPGLSAELAQIAGTTDEDKLRQQQLSGQITRMQAASDRLKQVAGAYDALLDSLVANKDSLDALVREYALSEWPGQDRVVLLSAKVHQVGGTHYTEKNVWTLFGAMPFHVMGGIVISFSLFDVRRGNLLVSRTIPVHSGFQPVKKLAAFISPS
jgi:hypothetical protein